MEATLLEGRRKLSEQLAGTLPLVRMILIEEEEATWPCLPPSKAPPLPVSALELVGSLRCEEAMLPLL